MMKKTLTLLALSAVLLTALTGCSGSSENNSKSGNESSIEQSADNSSKTEEISESSSDETSESSVNNSNVVAEQSTLTVYVLEVSEGSMKGESIPEEEGSDEIAKTITIYNDNIHTEDISKGMVVMITYTGELSPNGEEYTVNADSFEAL
ncbi:MAG: hypothetical protein ACI4M3_09195 [Acutalibacteraceae bacterium]